MNESLFSLASDSYAAVVYGFVSPMVVLATLATNGVVCAVLLQKSMRTPVNVLLLAMAVADTLTGACPMPCFLNFFTFASHDGPVLIPYSWCYLYLCLTDFLPTIFHTASLWLTVALAVQRFTTVCRGFDGKLPVASSARRGTDAGGARQAVKTVLAVYFAAALSQITRFFDSQYFPVLLEQLPTTTATTTTATTATTILQQLYQNISTTADAVYSTHNTNTYNNHNNDDNNYTTNTIGSNSYEFYCHIRRHDFFERYAWLYFNAYFWFRVVFIHLVPCVVLLVMNGMLICALRGASMRKKRLMQLDMRPRPSQQSALNPRVLQEERPPKESHVSVTTTRVQESARLPSGQDPPVSEEVEGAGNETNQSRKEEQEEEKEGGDQKLQKSHQRRNRRSSLKIFRRRLRQKNPEFKIECEGEEERKRFFFSSSPKVRATSETSAALQMELLGATQGRLPAEVAAEERNPSRTSKSRRVTCRSKSVARLSVVGGGGGGGGKASESRRRVSDIDNTTRMLVVVVGLVLLVELPQLCIIVVFVFMQNLHVVLIEDELLSRLTVTSNLCVILSYPLNFFIYCAMSRKFKTAINQLLDCKNIRRR